MNGLTSSLSAIRDFYEQTVLQTVQLQRPAEDDRLDTYELVQPAAHVGWIPPGGVLAPSSALTIPCIVVGLDQKVSSDEGTELGLRITAAVYDPGHQTQRENGALEIEPNFAGYITLLNLLDRLEAATQKAGVIGDYFKVSSPVEIRMYEEQPFPYWYGFLRFTVEGPAYPRTRYAGELQ